MTFGLMYSKDGHRFYLMLKDAETLKERPVTKEDMDMLEKQILDERRFERLRQEVRRTRSSMLSWET